MSLLNDVLRDLDQRAAMPAAEQLHLAGDARNASVEAEPAAPANGVDAIRWLFWPLISIACAFGVWLIMQPDPAPVVSSLEPIRPAEVAVSEGLEETVPAALMRDETDGRNPPTARTATVVEAVAPEPPRESVIVADGTGPASDIDEARPRTAVAPEAAPRPQAAPSQAQGPNYLALKNTGLPKAPPVEPAVAVKRRTPAPLAASERARRQIDAGDLAAAEETVMQRLGTHPDDRAARELQVGLLLRGARYDAALAAIDEGLSSDPDSPKLRLIKARLLAQRGG